MILVLNYLHKCNGLKNKCQQSADIETCMLNIYILIFSTGNILIVVFSNLPFGLYEGIYKQWRLSGFFLSNVVVKFVTNTYSIYGLDKVENSSISITIARVKTSF